MNAGVVPSPSKPWNPAAVAPRPRAVPSYGESMAALGASFGASFWLKKAAVALDGRDALDALADAEALVELMALRCRELGVL